MNKQTLTLKVLDIKRMNNSLNGNPNFKLTLESNNGVEIVASTLNDYMVNYRMGWNMIGKKFEFELKVNKKSNKVLDFKEAF
jgi:hypothetical protein